MSQAAAHAALATARLTLWHEPHAAGPMRDRLDKLEKIEVLDVEP